MGVRSSLNIGCVFLGILVAFSISGCSKTYQCGTAERMVDFSGTAGIKIGDRSSNLFSDMKKCGWSYSFAEGFGHVLVKSPDTLLVADNEGVVSSIRAYSGFRYAFGKISVGDELKQLRLAGIKDAICRDFESDEEIVSIYNSDSSRVIIFEVSGYGDGHPAGIYRGDEECSIRDAKKGKIVSIGVRVNSQ